MSQRDDGRFVTPPGRRIALRGDDPTAGLFGFPFLRVIRKRAREPTAPRLEFRIRGRLIAQVVVMARMLQNGVMDLEDDGSANDSAPGSGATETLSPERTLELLTRVHSGDAAALERLLARCLPPLRRWAHGRLPRYARDMQDTADLVQDTIVSALRRLGKFEPKHEGALQAYLRQALHNRITDIIRKKARR